MISLSIASDVTKARFEPEQNQPQILLKRALWCLSFIGVQGLFVDKRRAVVDIITDGSNQIVLGGPCFCRTYKCMDFTNIELL